VLSNPSADSLDADYGSGELWIMAAGSGDAVATGKSVRRYSDFAGWMDDDVVVYKNWIGGMGSVFTQWNVRRNEWVIDDLLSGFPIALNHKYVVVMDCMLDCTPYVMLRSPPKKDENCYHGCSSVSFPKHKITIDSWLEAFFQDWYGEERMLVAVMGVENKIEHTRLFLWNVRSDQLTPVAYGGVFGSFSPDDKYLSWITHGPLQSETVDLHSPLILDPFDEDEPAYLHWKDIATDRTIASLPVFALTPREAEADGILFPFFTFSPDSKWITIVSPAHLEDERDGVWSFRIVELSTGQLVHSIEHSGNTNFHNYRTLTWSPNSDRFVYRDADGNWKIFNINNRSILSLTAAHAKNLGSPTWSFDGRFLQFVERKPAPACQACYTYTTYILEVPD
jgi:hypothetical protein